MPGNLTYDEAAACMEGAFYAASGILGLKPTAGQKALVFGANRKPSVHSYVQFFKILWSVYYGCMALLKIVTW